MTGWLSLARVVATFGVVVLHVSSNLVDTAALGSLNWWVGHLGDSITRWTVPVFVMISGVLLSQPKYAGDFKLFYSRRLNKILVPFTFWSIFYSCIIYLFSDQALSVDTLMYRLVTGNPFYHMWYLYMIVGLYIFIPFINLWIQKMSDAELGALTLLAFVAVALDTWGAYLIGNLTSRLPILWFIDYLPFYLFGAFFSRPNLAKRIVQMRVKLTTSAFLTIFIGFYFVWDFCGKELALVFYDYRNGVVGLFALSIFSFFYTCPVPSDLKSLTKLDQVSFGVYLIHPFIIICLLYVEVDALLDSVVLYSIIFSIMVFCVSATTVSIIQAVPLLRKVV